MLRNSGQYSVTHLQTEKWVHDAQPFSGTFNSIMQIPFFASQFQPMHSPRRKSVLCPSHSRICSLKSLNVIPRFCNAFCRLCSMLWCLKTAKINGQFHVHSSFSFCCMKTTSGKRESCLFVKSSGKLHLLCSPSTSQFFLSLSTDNYVTI